MKLTFLGTGAADWQQPEPSGEFRRNASMLVDGALLMDGNATILDMLPTPSGWRQGWCLWAGMATLPSETHCRISSVVRYSFLATTSISGVTMPLRAASICVV